MGKLIEIETLDTKKITFSEPKKAQIKGSKGTFTRIEISYEDKPLIIKRENTQSFGIWGCEGKNSKAESYSFNLILQKGRAPTQDEEAWNNKMEVVIRACFSHTRKRGTLGEIPRPKRSYFERFSPLRYTEKGPTLNVKTLFSKEKDMIFTKFFNTEDEKVDPNTLMRQRVSCDVAIKIDSIFVSSLGVFLQLRLIEAIVEPIEYERLLEPKRVVEVEDSGDETLVEEESEDDE